MSQFFVTDETDKIDLGDGYYVEIKRMLSYGDTERIARETEGGAVATAVPLMLASIVSWNLPGPDGKPAPIAKETIEKLHPSVAQRILEEILKRNPFARTSPISSRSETPSEA